MSVVEDRLREAASLGDLDAVKMIVQSGKANVNHQHKVQILCSHTFVPTVKSIIIIDR